MKAVTHFLGSKYIQALFILFHENFTHHIEIVFGPQFLNQKLEI